jgi:hypothetical protein
MHINCHDLYICKIDKSRVDEWTLIEDLEIDFVDVRNSLAWTNCILIR